jgi:hypothetical protein
MGYLCRDPEDAASGRASIRGADPRKTPIESATRRRSGAQPWAPANRGVDLGSGRRERAGDGVRGGRRASGDRVEPGCRADNSVERAVGDEGGALAW